METLAEQRLRLRDGVPTPLRALSVNEAASVVGIAVSTLYARIADGKGPRLTKIGTRTVFLLSDVEDWLLAQRDIVQPAKV